jgi:hypothetical protein
MQSADQLLLNLVSDFMRPLWGISGFIDWCCHRATRIEETSGLRESLVHSLMGIQLGVPILLSLMYEINVLILLLCLVAFLLHEIVAHYDVHYATPRRTISIWEVHVHNYMATIPLYLLMLIAVLNWEVVLKLVSFDWSGGFSLTRLESPHGGSQYTRGYLIFMSLLCVIPYFEENLRCLRVWQANRRTAR